MLCNNLTSSFTSTLLCGCLVAAFNPVGKAIAPFDLGAFEPEPFAPVPLIGRFFAIVTSLVVKIGINLGQKRGQRNSRGVTRDGEQYAVFSSIGLLYCWTGLLSKHRFFVKERMRG